MKIYGVDFTSAPKREKPIVVADCNAEGTRLILNQFLEFSDWPAYEMWLGSEGEWIAGFDFPFGLPRRFVTAQHWPDDWEGMVRACVRAGKGNFVEIAMRAFQGAREKEDKHRRTDLVSDSHSPLKTKTNPPVGLMFYEGSWRLLTNEICIPVLRENGAKKIALEAFPGLAIKRLQERYYKNDKPKSVEANLAARKRIINELAEPRSKILSCSLTIGSRQLSDCLLHASGDWLDAVLCATQAHWGWLQKDNKFGLPPNVDPVEGWIVTA